MPGPWSLPGVGAFGKCVENLKRFDLFDFLKEEIAGGSPTSGSASACRSSSNHPRRRPGAKGMGVIKGRVVRFRGHEDTPHGLEQRRYREALRCLTPSRTALIFISCILFSRARRRLCRPLSPNTACKFTLLSAEGQYFRLPVPSRKESGGRPQAPKEFRDPYALRVVIREVLLVLVVSPRPRRLPWASTWSGWMTPT